MTDEQINIAIAKARGWKKEAKRGGWPRRIVRPDGSELWHYDGRGNSYGPITDWEYATQLKFIPNYCCDLNAIHLAVVAQSGEFQLRYRNALAEFCGAQHYHNATARERAEVFLKVFRKEDPNE